MANITVTKADARPLVGALVERAVVGAGTVFVGDLVYNDGGTPSVAHLPSVQQADGSTATTAYAIGVCVTAPNGGTAATAGETVDVVTFGPVAGFSGMTPGDVLYTSDDAGRLADAAGTTSHKVGRARSASVLFVAPPMTEA